MRDKTLTHYKGNYTQFESTKDERLRHQQKAYEAQEMKKEHLQAFVDRFRVNANRASQAQCKLKVSLIHGVAFLCTHNYYFISND